MEMEIDETQKDGLEKTKMNKMKRCIRFLASHWLPIATFLSVILGAITGIIVKATLPDHKWSHREIMYFKFIGELFLRMLKCLVLPLIASSIVTAICSIDLKLSRKIGSRAVVFYLSTCFLSVVLGIIIVISIQPGKHKGGDEVSSADGLIKHQTTTADTFLDLFRNMFPPNIVQACFQQYQTNLVENKTLDIDDWKIDSLYTDNINVIGVVVLSCVVGFAINVLRKNVTHIVAIINEFDQIVMKIVSWVIFCTPVGIFFLVMAQVVAVEDFSEIVEKLGLFFVTVLLGLILQGLVILPIIYFSLTRQNPYKYIGGLAQALITGFGCSSSSATLPITIKCLVDNNGIHPNLAKFMVPIGSVINMDGTALYEAVAAIFMAQLYDQSLTIGQLLAVSITATFASIGAAGIPSAGLITLVMVLSVVGVPADSIGIVISVDWLLDRFRTVVNIIGDSFGCGVVQHMCRADLEALEKEADAINEKFEGHMTHI